VAAQAAMDKMKLDPKPAEIAQFLVAGKKAIFSYGTADQLQSPRDGLRNYLEIKSNAGAAGDSNSRFFELPGVNHCGGGPGAGTVDFLTPLMKWVESGQSPDQGITATKVNTDSSVKFARPVCAYPSFPKYKGSGSPELATSFECAAG
jgi:hypothetical protein